MPRGRGGVDRLGDDLLARAALALDQDRDAGAGGLGGDGERGAELGRRADDLLEAERLGDLLGERAQLARGLAAVGGGVERGEQPIGRERLDDEIAGAGAHRVDRDSDVVLGGEDEQGKIGPERANLADQLGAFLARQPVIEQDRVELGLLRIVEHLLRAVEIVGAAHPPAGARADGGDQPALGGLVVDQQQATIGIRPHSRPSRIRDSGIAELGKGGLKSDRGRLRPRGASVRRARAWAAMRPVWRAPFMKPAKASEIYSPAKSRGPACGTRRRRLPPRPRTGRRSG